jgi:hypothetical protein
MTNPMPFEISPEAEAYLGRTTQVNGKEAGLDPSSHFEVKNAQGQVTDSYNGTHFFVGWQEPDVWGWDSVPDCGARDLVHSGSIAGVAWENSGPVEAL